MWESQYMGVSVPEFSEYKRVTVSLETVLTQRYFVQIFSFISESLLFFKGAVKKYV